MTNKLKLPIPDLDISDPDVIQMIHDMNKANYFTQRAQNAAAIFAVQAENNAVLKVQLVKQQARNKLVRPLLTGWVPTEKNLTLIQEGREKELPGYWLYQLQVKGPKIIRKVCGELFGMFYANR